MDESGVIFLLVVEVRIGTTYSHNEIPETNGQIVIDLQSTLAGKNKVIGIFSPLDSFYVTVIHRDSGNYILEVDKTVITAGETGEMYVEIRASNNAIKNNWEGYTIKVESFDSSDTYKGKKKLIIEEKEI